MDDICREELERYREWNRSINNWPDLLAIDTETEGVKFYDRAFAATVCIGDNTFYFELPESNDEVSDLLCNVDTWVFHNAKFDLQKLLLEGIISREKLDEIQIHDTETIWHLLNPTDRKGLKYLSQKLLGDTNEEEEHLSRVRRKLKIKKDEGLHSLPREVVVPYAKMDADKTYRLYYRTWPILKMESDRMLDIYRREQELTLVLLDIEAHGIRIDEEGLQTSISYCVQRVEKLFDSLQRMSGFNFNPNSPYDVADVLKERGIELPSTRKEQLLKVQDDEFVCTFLDYRKHNKLLTAWLESLDEEIIMGIYHPSFQPHTRTGRMSSRSQSG